MTMLTKACGVFLGYSKGEFEGKEGDKISWCNAAFSVPGTADTYVLKVNQDEVSPDSLVAYKANFLMIDFRYDAKFKTWKGVITDVFPTREAFDAAEVSDNIPPELFVSDAKAAAVAAVAKRV